MTANHEDDGIETGGYDGSTAVANLQRSEAFLDRALPVLADARCRSLLDVLRDAERGVSSPIHAADGAPVDRVAEFTDLVDGLAAAAPDRVEETADGRERFVTGIHHVCLPKLGRAGFVEYDDRSGSIRYHRDDRLETLLERIGAIERWPPLPDAAGRWLDLLADRRRRDALRVLAYHDEPVTLADLADEVAIREHGVPLTDVPAESVLRVYLSLYHAHVPRLAGAGVVAYDQDDDVVRLSTGAAELDALLCALDG